MTSAKQKLAALMKVAEAKQQAGVVVVPSAFDPVRRDRAIRQGIYVSRSLKNGDASVYNPDSKKRYRVSYDPATHSANCNCPDCYYRQVACKHIIATVENWKLKDG